MSKQSTRIIHGTMMRVANIGVLMIGSSCYGKSETALHLISRGHKLISDDAVQLQHHHNTIIASAPHPMCQKIHLRDIGLIDTSDHFTEKRIIENACLELVIELCDQHQRPDNSLRPKIHDIEYLGVQLPLICFSIKTYCPPAIKLETLVKQFKLSTLTRKLTQPDL